MKSVQENVRTPDLDALESPQETAERVKRILENGSEIFETKHRRKDGSLFDVEVSVSYVDRSDGVYLACFLRDITDRRQLAQEIQKQLAEKETLLREVHHRVKNNMATIESLLSLQASSTAHAEVKVALQDTISRVQSTRVLYDRLLLSDDLHEVSIKSYAEGLIDSLVMVFDFGKNITIEKHISDFVIDAKKVFLVGIIVNELLTNVFKYGFKDRKEGQVSVSIDKEESVVTLIIQDNGVGFYARALEKKSPGFGLTVVRMLVEQSGGTYSLSNDHGAKSVVRFEV